MKAGVLYDVFSAGFVGRQHERAGETLDESRIGFYSGIGKMLEGQSR
jgi:hypothetical protein